jgi:hypothetical protein
LAFEGIAEHNLLLNIANLEHNPEEVERKNLEEIVYKWE